MPPQVTFDPFPRTFLGRVLAGLAAIAIIVLAVFFLTVALVVAGVVLAIAVVRVLWLMHRARRRAASRPGAAVIDVEYSIVDERKPTERRPRQEP